MGSVPYLAMCICIYTYNNWSCCYIHDAKTWANVEATRFRALVNHIYRIAGKTKGAKSLCCNARHLFYRVGDLYHNIYM